MTKAPIRRPAKGPKVAIAQIEPILGDVDANLEKHRDAVLRANEEQADLLVFPELSLTGYRLKDTVPDWASGLKVTRPSGRIEYRFWQQGGGYDRNIHKADTLRKAMNYIHSNPVRRGLVEDPRQWTWSSRRAWELGETGPISIDRDSCNASLV